MYILTSNKSAQQSRGLKYQSMLCVSVCLQLRWQTSLQFVRFRKRINIQRPAPPHFERAKVLSVCKPYYLNPRKGLSLADLCEKPIEVLPYKEVVVNSVFYLLVINLFHQYFDKWNSFCCEVVMTNYHTEETIYSIKKNMK